VKKPSAARSNTRVGGAVSPSARRREPPHSANARDASLVGPSHRATMEKEGPNLMATVEHKQGTYSIAAGATQQFTFWWGKGSKAPNEFFDVSIAPHLSPQEMEPLQQTGRAVVWDHRGGVGVELLLTLQNPNKFAVTFEANHVHIY
jgi:hypothetical protein